jgi:hypothetical protein
MSIALMILSAMPLVAQSDTANKFRLNGASSWEQQASPILIARLNLPAEPTTSTSELPDNPTPQQNAAKESDAEVQPKSHGKKYSGAPPAASGGPFEMSGGTADKKYWGATGLMFGSTVADIELTQRCQEVGQCSYAPSSLRSRAAMYGIGLPANAGLAYLSYRMKKHHSPIWFAPQVLMTGANAYVSLHAYRRSQR